MSEYMTWKEFKERLGVTDDGSRDDYLVDLDLCDKEMSTYQDDVFMFPPNDVSCVLKHKQHIHMNMPDTDVIRITFRYDDEDFSE